jgi:hypothetical protein
VTRRSYLFYPLAFAIYPVLSLYASNLAKTHLGDTVYAHLFGVALCVMVWLVSLLVTRSWEKASVGAGLGLLLFYSYNHVSVLLGINESLLRDRHLVSVCILIFGAGLYLLRRHASSPRKLTSVLNIVGGVLIIFPLFRIATFSVMGKGESDRLMHAAIERCTNMDTIRATRVESRPDIYYFIVDAYSRADVLRDVYGYDNTHFIENLEKRGFVVNHEARSNYALTEQSLPSALNLTYLPIPDGIRSLKATFPLMKRNRLFSFLKAIGYTTITYPTAMVTDFSDADLYPGGGIEFMNEFFTMYYASTPIPSLLRGVTDFSFRRKRTDDVFRHVVTIPDMPQPTVTFAHVSTPHQPYMYGRTYHEELDSLNRTLVAMIDTILARSSQPPIVVIQGDHGHRKLTIADGEVSKRSLKDAMGVLNAYYLPDGGSSMMYQGVTPVNTWRLVLDYYFGANLGPLEDRVFFSWVHNEYTLTEVTDILTTTLDSTYMADKLKIIRDLRPPGASVWKGWLTTACPTRPADVTPVLWTNE